MRSLGSIFASVILASLGAGPSVAQKAEGKGSPAVKLDACRKAAIAANGSTDFTCDWKTVTAAAPGAAFTGRYRIAEKGLDGEMTVLEGGSDSEGPPIGQPGPSATEQAYTDEAGPAAGTAGEARTDGVPPVLVALMTVTRGAGHTCNLDLRGVREGDELVLKEVTEDACVVRLASTRQLNMVRISGTDACRNFCGLAGGFEGAWRLRR